MPSLKRRRQKDAWVIVATTSGLTEAEIIAGLLKTAEIPNYLQQETVGRVFGISFGSMGQVNVLVPQKFAAEAIALLDEPTLDDAPPGLQGPIIDFPDSDR
jgi:hypothetical protein